MLKIRIYLGLLLSLILVICIALYTTDILNVHPFMYHVTNHVSEKVYNFYPPETELNKQALKADDPKVVEALIEKFLNPPSSKPYKLNDNFSNPSMGQAQRVDQILTEMRNGFYIECGALDGETRSNTLFFERERGWRGLLIEADPKNFEKLLTKNRKAYASSTCLAPSDHPISVQFQQQKNQGHIVGHYFHDSGGSERELVLEVQCFPFLSYLKALNVSTVDYFSLDVEGAEFDILQSIPWKKVDIKTLSVEFIHDQADKYSIREFMRKNGYFVHSEVKREHWLANDFIFVREDLYYTS